MGQSGFSGIEGKILALLLIAGAMLGCDRGAPESHAATTVTIASLVPAATDLIIEMGEGGKLVAVSDYDSAKVGGKALPKVGAYQSADWEKLAQIKPTVMIIQMDPARMPAEFAQRVNSLGIHLVNVKINRLEDIFLSIDQIGGSIGAGEKSAALLKKLRDQLDRVKARIGGRPLARTIITHNSAATEVIGTGNYLDDLLTISGGKNAVEGSVPWPTIDREKFVSMNPEVVIQLLPEAPEQVMGQSKETWNGMKDLAAVKSGRVYVLREWFVLQPGGHVGELAELLADRLHPETASTQPSGRE